LADAGTEILYAKDGSMIWARISTSRNASTPEREAA